MFFHNFITPPPPHLSDSPIFLKCTAKSFPYFAWRVIFHMGTFLTYGSSAQNVAYLSEGLFIT
jgi:hypothetical protein